MKSIVFGQAITDDEYDDENYFANHEPSFKNSNGDNINS